MIRAAFVLCCALAMAGCSADNSTVEHEADGAPPENADAAVPGDFGESCASPAECVSAMCFDGTCSAPCDPGDINSCAGYDAMCIAFAAVPSGCLNAPLSLGDDADDNRFVEVGSRFSQSFTPGDGDLFRLDTDPAGGALWLEVAGDPGVDVSIDVFTDRGDVWMIVDDAGPGEPEKAELTPDVPAPILFVVVRGDAAGEYSVDWACNLSDCG